VNARVTEPRCHEFYFAELDTLVQVRPGEEAVSIRATRATFSARRQENFIHELAAEGFIDDDYRWFSFASPFPARRVCWRVDPSWVALEPAVRAATGRFVRRLLAGAGLLWIGLMTLLFLHIIP